MSRGTEVSADAITRVQGMGKKEIKDKSIREGAVVITKIPDVLIRWIIQADHKEVLDIDFHSYTDDLSLDILRDRAVIAVVSEDSSGNVVGFCIYRLGTGSVEILRLAVQPKYRRCGIATAMIKRITEKVMLNRRRVCVALVDERSLNAHLLLKSCGFVGTQCGNEIRFRYERGE